MGEFLANRIVHKKWVMVKGLLAKMLVWGILGMMIVLMFSLYTQGVHGAIAKGLLWAEPSFWSRLLTAFYISAIMNLTFGAVFMAAHRITDTYIDSVYDRFAGKSAENPKPTIGGVVSTIDWPGFFKFVIGKTIPLFWIPAHTITFMLPDQYKVLFAASLSIVLGLILSYAKLRK